MDRRTKQYKIEYYGGEEAYSREMQRRAALRKTIGPGKKFTSETARAAILKRWRKENNESK